MFVGSQGAQLSQHSLREPRPADMIHLYAVTAETQVSWYLLCHGRLSGRQVMKASMPLSISLLAVKPFLTTRLKSTAFLLSCCFFANHRVLSATQGCVLCCVQAVQLSLENICKQLHACQGLESRWGHHACLTRHAL